MAPGSPYYKNLIVTLSPLPGTSSMRQFFLTAETATVHPFPGGQTTEYLMAGMGPSGPMTAILYEGQVLDPVKLPDGMKGLAPSFIVEFPGQADNTSARCVLHFSIH